ncbi:hypothetical protein CHISP_3145 [Chitinispirillum alkaliphilum]|nr:hypothetical protein CHISP_3145 [Chitinispirillum alkaliphilum]
MESTLIFIKALIFFLTISIAKNQRANYKSEEPNMHELKNVEKNRFGRKG